jgi:hypothetical protein
VAFVAEDGTGLADANALCDVAYADAYFADRNITAWTGADSAKQAALIKATDYIETRWSSRFRGYVLSEDQALSFPRTGINHDGEVPHAIRKATAEYALRALGGTALAPDPSAASVGGAVISTRKVVGPIETETKYSSGATPSLFQPYPMADELVRKLLRTGLSVVRA